MKEKYRRLLLERWVLIDRVIFGEEKTPGDLLKGKRYKDYLSSKGAFLSNIFEMYSVLDYEPLFDAGYQENKLINSGENDEVLKENFEEMKNYLDDMIEVSSDKVLEEEDKLCEEIKNNLRDINLTESSKEESDKIISCATNKCFKSRILDEVFLTPCIEAISDKDKFNSWKFKILNGSYASFKRYILEFLNV